MPELENKAPETASNTTTTTGAEAQKAAEAKAEATTETKQEEKLFSQADLDAAIEKRLAREKKNAERKAKEAEEAAKAKDDSEEIRALKDLIRAKDQKIVKQEAAKTAGTMGIDPDFIDAVVALADLSEIKLDNNGEVDTDELKDVLKSIIDKYPKFVATKTEAKKEEPAGFIKAGTPSQPTEQKLDDAILRNAFKLKK